MELLTPREALSPAAGEEYGTVQLLYPQGGSSVTLIQVEINPKPVTL